MGANSTAKLPTRGKVNEDWEILMNTYAVAFDALNRFMLTRQPGKYDPTTLREIHGRFAILKLLARKYAPHKLKAIEKLEQLTKAHFKGQISDRQFLAQIRTVTVRHGLNPQLVMLAEHHINAAERLPKLPKIPAPKMPKRRVKKPTPLGLLDMLFGMPRRRR